MFNLKIIGIIRYFLLTLTIYGINIYMTNIEVYFFIILFFILTKNILIDKKFFCI